MTIIVYEIRPEDFKPSIEVAACYLEIEGELLLVECSSSKPEPGTWGVPAGKLEIGETPAQAAKRELFEETGILVEDTNIHSMGSLYMRKPHIDYVYHLFQIVLKTKPKVRLSSENPNYLWATAQEIETLPLMTGAFEPLQRHRSYLNSQSLESSQV
jgi:phosphatase NudJ